jgi:hypothetical protein
MAYVSTPISAEPYTGRTVPCQGYVEAGYSQRCSRTAKVEETRERTINGEKLIVVERFCTQHSEAYYKQVQKRRSDRFKSDSNRREDISLKNEAARLALELLRLQGMDGLSQTAPWRHEELVEECRILRAEVERLTAVRHRIYGTNA